jgi:hypothetical protein
MTLIDEIFDDEMELACSMRATLDVYWRGYAAGIMRARFGSVAVSDTYHAEWHQVDASGDQARGYRDGYSKLLGLVAGSPEVCQTDLRPGGFRTSS